MFSQFSSSETCKVWTISGHKILIIETWNGTFIAGLQLLVINWVESVLHTVQWNWHFQKKIETEILVCGKVVYWCLHSGSVKLKIGKLAFLEKLQFFYSIVVKESIKIDQNQVCLWSKIFLFGQIWKNSNNKVLIYAKIITFC